MNKFQKIIHRRIHGLVLDAQSAGEPGHNPTSGYLREKYIIQFLKDMTPWGVSLTSGVLFDATDTTSPQIDMIAVNNSSLPAIALHEGLSMVPVEAALIAAEIKSILTTEGLDQLKKQNDAVTQLQVVMFGQNPIIPTIIVALGSDLSADRVSEWMQEEIGGVFVNGNTVMCCVIGKFYLIRQLNEIKMHIADGNYIETLSFISDYWKGLSHLQKLREQSIQAAPDGYPHPLEAYLKGMAMKPD